MFSEMKEAIRKKMYPEMQTIADHPEFQVNKLGGGDSRTVLHTAVAKDDKEAIKILLNLPGVDPNIRTSKGHTPLMLSVWEGRLQAMETLLEDPKVDTDVEDYEDHTLVEMVSHTTVVKSDITKNKALEMLKKISIREKIVTMGDNVAILIGNSVYKNTMNNLPGANRDLDEMTAILKSVHYTVYVLENTEDILASLEETMQKIPEGSVSNLHVHYLGHGQFRSSAKVGRELGEDDADGGTRVFETEEAIGEVLLSVTGEACTVDELLWELLEAGKPRALNRVIAVCVMLDMCRNKLRDVSALHNYEIKDVGLDLKMDIKKLGYNNKIMTVSSALLGDTASDSNSFTWRLAQHYRCPNLLLLEP